MTVEIKDTTAFLKGRLDTAASLDVQKTLEENLLPKADKTLTIDCTDLEYISSSGLRIFLMLRKEAGAKGGKIVVKGISDDIRKVFMMTGFINLFSFE
ncbi:MAG: STAS domain-containing protein [Bacteroidales bacterium]|nr:STAS domain-containing protein [Bacteroidales bacterium]